MGRIFTVGRTLFNSFKKSTIAAASSSVLPISFSKVITLSLSNFNRKKFSLISLLDINFFSEIGSKNETFQASLRLFKTAIMFFSEAFQKARSTISV